MKRARRWLPTCTYDEERSYDAAHRALCVTGQGGIYDSRGCESERTPDSGDNNADDDAGDVDDTSSDDSLSSEEDERHCGSSRRALGAGSNDEWAAALRHVQVYLGTDAAGLKDIVRGLSYVEHALSAGFSVADQARVAFRRLMWNTPVSDADRDACIAYAVSLAQEVTHDRTELRLLITPLEKFTCGRLVKSAQRIVSLCAIALMAQMVDALLAYRKHGTPQTQAFHRLLSTAGLDDNAIAMLAPRLCTETALECAQHAGAELARALNFLTPQARISAMFHNLASFEQVAARHPPPPGGRTRWCRPFGRSIPRNIDATASEQGAARVTVTLLVRDAHTRYAGSTLSPNCLARPIDQALPVGYATSEALFKPRLAVSNLDGGPLVATHRAHAVVPAPTGATVIRAVLDLLAPAAGDANPLSQFLDALARDAPQHFPRCDGSVRGGCLGLPTSSAAGAPVCAYVAVRIGGRPWKLGRQSILKRSFAPELVGATCDFGTCWLAVDPDLHVDELCTLLAPPFAPLVGLVEVYVALTEPPPCGSAEGVRDGPLHLGVVRQVRRDRAIHRARLEAKRALLRSLDVEGRRVPQRHNARLREAMDKAEADAKARSAVVTIAYPDAPVPLTQAVLERAAITVNAMTAFERVRRAEPGGADAVGAAARFREMCAPPSGGS